MPRILRDSLRSFCSSSVSNEPSSTIEPASGRTLNAMGATYFTGVGERHRRAVVDQLARPGRRPPRTWLVELVDAGEPAAGDRLVGATTTSRVEPGLVVQRLEHRHRGHRGAVRVGDDALAAPRRSPRG